MVLVIHFAIFIPQSIVTCSYQQSKGKGGSLWSDMHLRALLPKDTPCAQPTLHLPPGYLDLFKHITICLDSPRSIQPLAGSSALWLFLGICLISCLIQPGTHLCQTPAGWTGAIAGRNKFLDRTSTRSGIRTPE
jgi:hypothetical protein